MIVPANVGHLSVSAKANDIFFQFVVNISSFACVIMSLIFSLSNILIGTAAYCSG